MAQIEITTPKGRRAVVDYSPDMTEDHIDSVAMEIDQAEDEKAAPLSTPTIDEALFPRSTRSTREDKGIVSDVLSGAGDVLSLIPRGVAAAATAAGGGGSNDVLRELAKTRPDEDTKGGLRLAQEVAYSPSTYIPIGGMLAGAGKVAGAAGSVAAKAGIPLLPKIGEAAAAGLQTVSGASKAGAAGKEPLRVAATRAAAQGGAQGAVGGAIDDENNARGAAIGGAAGTVLGGGLGVVGRAVPALGREMVEAAEKNAGGPGALARGLADWAGETSGVKPEALLAYSQKESRPLIEGAAGKQREIGEKINNALENADAMIPEAREVARIIEEELPPIDPSAAIQTLLDHRVQNPATKSAEKANEMIDGIIERLATIGEANGGKIPAKLYRDIRIQYDAEADAAFNKDYKSYIERALLATRRTMADDLRDAGQGTEYADLMGRYSDKLQKIDKMKGFLGSNPEVRDRRIQSFVDNLFNKNKDAQQRAVSDLGEIFGEDFLGEAKWARYAEMLGDEGKPPLLPTQPTGRSLTGLALGGPLASPAITTRAILPAARGLEDASRASIRAVGSLLSGGTKKASLADNAGTLAPETELPIPKIIPGQTRRAVPSMFDEKGTFVGPLGAMDNIPEGGIVVKGGQPLRNEHHLPAPDEEAFASSGGLPLSVAMSPINRAGLGGLAGYTLTPGTDEDKRNGAMMGAGAGLSLGVLSKLMGKGLKGAAGAGAVEGIAYAHPSDPSKGIYAGANGKREISLRALSRLQPTRQREMVPKPELADLRKRARESLESKVDIDFKNDEFGDIANISKASADEIVSAKSVNASADAKSHFAAVDKIEELFRIAKERHSHADKRGEPSIKMIHRFYAPLEVDGEHYVAKITVKEFQSEGDGRRIYTVKAIKTEKAPESQAGLHGAKP